VEGRRGVLRTRLRSGKRCRSIQRSRCLILGFVFLLFAVMELSNCIGRPTAGLVTSIGEFESRWSWRELLRFSKDGDTFGAASMKLAAPAFVGAFKSKDFPGRVLDPAAFVCLRTGRSRRPTTSRATGETWYSRHNQRSLAARAAVWCLPNRFERQAR